MTTPATLWEYYTGQGQKLPPIRDRAVLYERYGLGSASSYSGTAEQNTALLQQLLHGPAPDDGTSVPDDVLALIEQHRAELESLTVHDIVAILQDALSEYAAEFAEALASYGLSFDDVNDALSFMSGFPPGMTLYDLILEQMSGNAPDTVPEQVIDQLPPIQEPLPAPRRSRIYRYPVRSRKRSAMASITRCSASTMEYRSR